MSVMAEIYASGGQKFDFSSESFRVSVAHSQGAIARNMPGDKDRGVGGKQGGIRAGDCVEIGAHYNVKRPSDDSLRELGLRPVFFSLFMYIC